MLAKDKHIEISVVHSRDRKLHRQFMQFPHKLYAGNENWVPFFNVDMRAFLTKKHPYYQNYPAQFFIATRGGETVGTLSVSYNHAYNESHDINTAHFFFYETIDDYEITKVLFAKGEKWAREQGAKHITGPFLSGLGTGSGLLIKGFEHPAMMTMMRYNPPYYEHHLVELGFKKHADLSSYSCRTHDLVIDPRIERVAEIVKEMGGFEMLTYKSSKEVVAVAYEVFDEFLNKLIGEYPENYPLAKNEIAKMIKDIKVIMRADLLCGVKYENQLVGYGLGFPDITKAIQKSKGRITPISIIRMLHCKKTTSRYTCNGLGILPEHQGLGGSAMLYLEIFKGMARLKPSYVELTQIGDTTERITSEMTPFIKEKCKIHRILTKPI